MKKKLGALCLLAMLLVIFCEGCASRLSLEDCGWTMTAVFDKDGQVVACAPSQKDLYPDAKAMVITFFAENGKLKIHREGMEDTLTGTYRQTEINPDGRLYELSVQGIGRGFGGCAFTKHATGENVPTFAVQFPEKYSLYFTGEQP